LVDEVALEQVFFSFCLRFSCRTSFHHCSIILSVTVPRVVPSPGSTLWGPQSVSWGLRLWLTLGWSQRKEVDIYWVAVRERH
jgi:hypothetical protein